MGPVLIRRLWDHGLPEDVQCADGGTGGMDVAFQMRGVKHVILVDACSSGSEPGTIFELPGEAVEQLPPLSGIHLHAFRWDHALAFGRWLLKEDYPKKITVYLIEGERYEVGEGLTDQVDKAIDRLKVRLLDRWNAHERGAGPKVAHVRVELTADGYLRISKETSERFFPEHALVALWREGELYLLPTRGAAAGGLVLKQRNASGDRCLLLSEVFQFQVPSGFFDAVWDDRVGGVKIHGSAKLRAGVFHSMDERCKVTTMQGNRMHSLDVRPQPIGIFPVGLA